MPRGGANRVAEGRVCKESAIYPFQLCKAILMGCRRQLVTDGRLTIGIAGIQRPEEEMTYDQLCKVIERKGIFENESELLAVADGEAEFRHALTGQPLESSLVRAARKEELEYFASQNV